MARRRMRRRNSSAKKGPLTVQINEIAGEITEDVKAAMNEAADKVAQQAVQKLQNTSPKRPGGGSYAAGWTYKQTPDGGVVHNATDYQLTHLLENGHVIRNKYGTYGRAPAHEHIKPVEERANNEIVEEVGRLLS